MTYNEALLKKSEYLEPFINIEGFELEIFIIPKQQTDIKKYKDIALMAYIRHQLSDDHAKLYSTDNEYELGGLFYDQRGAIIYQYPFEKQDLTSQHIES